MGLLYFLTVFLAEHRLAAFPGTISETATMIWQADNVFLIIIQSFRITEAMHSSDPKQRVNNRYFCANVHVKPYLDSWAEFLFAHIAFCFSHPISILSFVDHDFVKIFQWLLWYKSWAGEQKGDSWRRPDWGPMYKVKLTEMWRNVTHMGTLQFHDVKSLTSTLNRFVVFGGIFRTYGCQASTLVRVGAVGWGVERRISKRMLLLDSKGKDSVSTHPKTLWPWTSHLTSQPKRFNL